MTTPTVSVLVKCFNHEGYVRQTIDSILAQTYQNFEVIVLDDGSTDATASVLREYDDPRIVLEIKDRNGGISAAMNRMIEKARGRYLAILNSDDYALPSRLERQVAVAERRPDVSAVFGGALPVDDRGEATGSYNDFRASFHMPDFTRKSWLRRFFFSGNCLCAPTALIRRSAYDRVGPYDRRLHNLQDLDMWVRMAKAGLGLHVLDEACTAFRVRDNHANASAPRADNRLRHTFETLQILRHYRDLDDATLVDLFDFPGSADAKRSLGLLAAQIPEPAHMLFGMQLIFETSHTEDECKQLIRMAGSIDSFNMEQIGLLRRRAADLANLLHHRAGKQHDGRRDTTGSADRPPDRGLTGERLCVSGRPEIWLVFHGERHHIVNPVVYCSLFTTQDHTIVDSVEHIPRGCDIAEGTCLIRADTSDDVFLVTGPSSHEVRKYFIAPTALARFKFAEDTIRSLPAMVVRALPSGDDIKLCFGDD